LTDIRGINVRVKRKNVLKRQIEPIESVRSMKMDKEVKLSKPAFVVIDQLIKEHKDLYGCITFRTFCDGEHKRITTKQLMREFDALYEHYYGKGANGK
jgi:hypothetical protein